MNGAARMNDDQFPRPSGLSETAKADLLSRFSPRRSSSDASRTQERIQPTPATFPPHHPATADFSDLPGYNDMIMIRKGAGLIGIDNPYFRQHDGLARDITRIDGEDYINFSSYNYVGLNGHPAVTAAAKAAIDQYGTTVSASRIVSGERAVHRDLERDLARFYGVEDCITLVSGHATNASVIGHLMDRNDLIIHDCLIHNSVVEGAMRSPARRIAFNHNDPASLDQLLAGCRADYQRVMIVLEGLYSMDGDAPDLPAFIKIARQYGAWLFVDEAHSLGVLGRTGKGLAEHWGVDPREVDIWMGTLSKSLAACGGYIAGRKELIEHLRYTVPGFVFSVGMSPPLAAAARAALHQLQAEPERVLKLQSNGNHMLTAFKAAGFNVASSNGTGIVPLVTGSSIRAARLSDQLFKRKINVQPILYPAVPEKSARLRFFLSSDHSHAQIDHVTQVITEILSAPDDTNAALLSLMQSLQATNDQ